MSTSVLAAVMPAPHQSVELREFREPDLPVGGALLRTAMSEVCGTDVHLWQGQLPIKLPVILGHETVGRIEALGTVAARRFGGCVKTST